MYTHFIHKKNKAHSINQILQTFGFALKSNLKLQTYLKAWNSKRKIINSRAEFPINIYHSVSRNRVKKYASAQKSAKITFKSAKSS